MEENNNNGKGPGIFYAVVGVATLVVAIIGATFAYFSATASNNNITGTTAKSGGITLTVTPVTSTGSNMIPLNLITGDTSGVDTTDQFADAISGKCVDDNGNNICQIYSITVKNGSDTSQVQVRGTLNLTSTASNMYWQLLSDAGTSTTRATFATNVKQGTTGNVTVGGNTGGSGTTAASQTLAGSASATYYVLVWLEETGKAQESTDASRTFTGTVTFNAVDTDGNSSGVTATFNAS